MKTILATILVSLAMLNTACAAETKQVCIDKTDKNGQVVKGKDGKPQQQCKTVTVHKKLEGTAVPDKK